MAAAQGHATGQGALGVMYRDGFLAGAGGVEMDHALAFEYFTLAARQESAAAMCNLGAMVRQGLGCEADLALAIKWSGEAAARGHVGGMSDLGACLVMPGPLQDLKRATVVLSAAAMEGDEPARRLLGRLQAGERFAAIKAMSALAELAHAKPADPEAVSVSCNEAGCGLAGT